MVTSIVASGKPFVELYALSCDGLQRTLDRYPAIRDALLLDMQQKYEEVDQLTSLQPLPQCDVNGMAPEPKPEPEPELETAPAPALCIEAEPPTLKTQ